MPAPACRRRRSARPHGRGRGQGYRRAAFAENICQHGRRADRSHGPALMPPRIAINGRFLTQRSSGVQRFAMETITAIDALLDGEYAPPKGRVELLAPRKARDFPLKNIPLRRVGFFSGYIWEQIEFPLIAAGR